MKVMTGGMGLQTLACCDAVCSVKIGREWMQVSRGGYLRCHLLNHEAMRDDVPLLIRDVALKLGGGMCIKIPEFAARALNRLA